MLNKLEREIKKQNLIDAIKFNIKLPKNLMILAIKYYYQDIQNKKEKKKWKTSLRPNKD